MAETTTTGFVNRLKPLCEVCRTAPAELKFNGTGWKKRCSTCQRAYELACDRERIARRKQRAATVYGEV